MREAGAWRVIFWQSLGVFIKLSNERGPWTADRISTKSRAFYEKIPERVLWMADWFSWCSRVFLQNGQTSSTHLCHSHIHDLTVDFSDDMDVVPGCEHHLVSVSKRWDGACSTPIHHVTSRVDLELVGIGANYPSSTWDRLLGSYRLRVFM